MCIRACFLFQNIIKVENMIGNLDDMGNFNRDWTRFPSLQKCKSQEAGKNLFLLLLSFIFSLSRARDGCFGSRRANVQRMNHSLFLC